MVGTPHCVSVNSILQTYPHTHSVPALGCEQGQRVLTRQWDKSHTLGKRKSREGEVSPGGSQASPRGAI
jgi:hypothetical protein